MMILDVGDVLPVTSQSVRWDAERYRTRERVGVLPGTCATAPPTLVALGIGDAKWLRLNQGLGRVGRFAVNGNYT